MKHSTFPEIVHLPKMLFLALARGIKRPHVFLMNNFCKTRQITAKLAVGTLALLYLTQTDHFKVDVM